MYRMCTNPDSFSTHLQVNSEKCHGSFSRKHKIVCLCFASAKQIKVIKTFKEVGELKD